MGNLPKGRLSRDVSSSQVEPTEISENSHLIENNSVLFLEPPPANFVKCRYYDCFKVPSTFPPLLSCQLQNLLTSFSDFSPRQVGEFECLVRLFWRLAIVRIKSDLDSIWVPLIFKINGGVFIMLYKVIWF